MNSSSRDHAPDTCAAQGTTALRSDSAVFQCAISADVARRALLAVSTDETRYYLQGLHVSPHPEGGAYVVGTDGHVLLIFHDKDATVSGSAIIAPDEHIREELTTGGARARVLFARKDRLYVAEVGHDSADALFEAPAGKATAAQYVHATIDGKFPDWRKVFQPVEAGHPLPIIDARLLNRMAKALSFSRPSRQLLLRPTGPDATKHPVWAFGEINYGCGVIMGCTRPSGRLDAPPSWLGEIAPPETPAPPDGAGRDPASTTEAGQSPGRNP